jgi:diaminopimelate decarboxylase
MANSIDALFPVTIGRDEEGKLTVAGQGLRALAKRFGTPLYLYDADTLLGQVRRLREQLTRFYPGDFEITYASKAYFSLNFARHLVSAGLGVDVVSLGELGMARRAGFAGNRVHLHGNNKSIEELSAAMKWGVQAIVVDSLEELEVLEELAAEAKIKPRIWLRISPGVAIHSHSYLQTAHNASKFGLPIEGGAAAEAIRRAKASPWLHLSGLHTHLGSQFFEVEPYQQAIMGLMKLAEENDYIPEELSPGGGWGVPYIADQPEGDPALWIETVSKTLIEECSRRGWPLPRLVVEPGRWLVARSGVTVYSVGTTKTAGDGTRFVAVDGGMADNLRPALYQAQYSACLVDRPDAQATQKVNLVGKFCETGDQLIADLPLPDVRRGDLIAIPASGAYQLSMASNYNLAPRPAALWLEGDSIEVLQRREEMDECSWWIGE